MISTFLASFSSTYKLHKAKTFEYAISSVITRLHSIPLTRLFFQIRSELVIERRKIEPSTTSKGLKSYSRIFKQVTWLCKSGGHPGRKPGPGLSFLQSGKVRPLRASCDCQMALASSFDAKIWAEGRSVSATVKCVIAAGVRSNDWSLTPIKSVNSVSINLSMILKFISVFIWIQSRFNSGMTLPGLWSMQIESQKPRQQCWPESSCKIGKFCLLAC